MHAHRKDTTQGSRRRAIVAALLIVAAVLLVARLAAVEKTATLLVIAFPALVILASQLLVGSLEFVTRWATALGYGLWGVEGCLAGMGLASSPRRTATAVATFTAVLGAVGATTVLLGSFRHSVDQWFATAFPQDLIVLSGASIKGVHVNPMPPSLQAAIRQLPGVAEVLTLRSRTIEYRDEEVYIVAQDLSVAARRGVLVRPENWEPLPRSFVGTVLATPAFLQHFGHRVGDTVDLPTPNGRREFGIAGRYLEYAGTTGALQIDSAEYQSFWGDSLADIVSVFLTPPTNPAAVKQAIATGLGQEYALHVLTREEFLSANTDQIAKSFSFTRAIDVLLILVGVLGISITVLTSLLERQRELGVLRAIGALSNQLVRSARLEFVMLSGVSAITGAVVAVVFGYVLTRIVVREGLGWYVAFRPSWGELATVLVGAVLLSWVVSAYPARRVSRLAVVDAIWRE